MAFALLCVFGRFAAVPFSTVSECRRVKVFCVGLCMIVGEQVVVVAEEELWNSEVCLGYHAEAEELFVRVPVGLGLGAIVGCVLCFVFVTWPVSKVVGR